MCSKTRLVSCAATPLLGVQAKASQRHVARTHLDERHVIDEVGKRLTEEHSTMITIVVGDAVSRGRPMSSCCAVDKPATLPLAKESRRTRNFKTDQGGTAMKL